MDDDWIKKSKKYIGSTGVRTVKKTQQTVCESWQYRTEIVSLRCLSLFGEGEITCKKMKVKG